MVTIYLSAKVGYDGWTLREQWTVFLRGWKVCSCIDQKVYIRLYALFFPIDDAYIWLFLYGRIGKRGKMTSVSTQNSLFIYLFVFIHTTLFRTDTDPFDR